MAVPPAPDGADALTEQQETDATHDPSPPEDTGARRAPGRWRLPTLVGLVVAVLLAAGALTWVSLTRTGAADTEQERRDEIRAQGEQFMLRMGTFGPDLLEGDRMPVYRKRVTGVITPKFATSFEQQVVVAEQLVRQSKLERSAEVFSTGVSSLDKESADALVAGSFTDSVDGDPGRPYPFRICLDMVRVEGQWLVDDFAPVTENCEGTGEGDDSGTPPGGSPGGGSSGGGSSGGGSSGGGSSGGGQ